MPAAWGVEEYKDIESSNFYAEACASGDEDKMAKTMHGLRIMARDHARIPFQWDDSPNAGFTSADAKPWMRVHDEYKKINAAQQMADPNSILSFYRQMLRLRKHYKDVFVFGSHKLLEPEDEKVWKYVKQSPYTEQCRRVLVVMNFSREERPVGDVAAALECEKGDVRLLVGTAGVEESSVDKSGWPALGVWESRIYTNFKL
ncbi:alpha-glucosidase [Verticillium alfalfae VaMs.102]|uniref:Alpha-glucosidase n=1 Tax=Verticillium alfalfae (strain VaMs.102 / ATCC MYA-4576 / FGSC 10136) TaxID=526221 RepID=C9SYV3_VERA1|nr:alpha-glucosidase [Verticillium alfalfae VaMs.102]EEY23968.1 alpha-glucosidase [Verticillium alfalfae VaMs.102]